MSSFTDLPDLAAESLGGWAMWANDEFFVQKENLIKAHAAEWREHDYTDRGKWMDGWETRRRREPGCDVCIIRLGLPGLVRGVVVDTAYFRGNYPAECLIEGARIGGNADLQAIHDPATEWRTLVARSPLKGDAKNSFEVTGDPYATHLRLTIFPDGGVARLRVHGAPAGNWKRLGAFGGLVDLAALENGAESVACSDMFFGSRHHLILPGKPLTMGGGWETRRRRGPGHDWNEVRLAAPGRIWRVEVDTMHFKGNAPGRCSIDARRDGNWRTLLPETPLQPHTNHAFEDELRVLGVVDSVRLNVFPDGGVARLRCWGEPVLTVPERSPLDQLNRLEAGKAAALLKACCGSDAWVEKMLAERPYVEPHLFYSRGDWHWWKLSDEQRFQALLAHPRIGERKAPEGQPPQHREWSQQEQSSTQSASEATLAELARLNREYEDKFNLIYIVCATGKSAEQMLAILKARLGNTRDDELRTAFEEQAKITQLRMRKLLAKPLEVE